MVEPGEWPATNSVWEPIITESASVVRTVALGCHKHDKLVIWDIEMTEEERALVAGDVSRHQGRPYALLQLFGQLIDNKLLFGANVFRRLAKYDPLDICSHLTGDAFQRIGITFGEPGYAQSPDDQDDFLRAHSTINGRKVTLLWDDFNGRA